MRPRAAMLALLAAAAVVGCGVDPRPLSRPPTAFAGFDGRAEVGAEIALDGSQSVDPDGDPLRYTWRLVTTPAGSNTLLEPDDEPLTRFVPDEAGTYVVALTVSDGTFEDRDLVAVLASQTSTAPEPLRLSVRPLSCNVAFADPAASGCADASGTVSITPELEAPATSTAALSVEWTFVRLPAGLSTSDMQARLTSGPHGPLTFVPPRPGDYWIAGRLVGRQAVSAPAYATLRVHELSSPLPLARIDGPRSAVVRERVVLDGRGSVVGTSSAASFSWRFFSDPSDGAASLVDRATGCAPNVCRRFVPVVPGVYVVRLDVSVGTATGAPALWTVEVAP